MTAQIFLLGAGYSARAFASLQRDRAEAIFGTTRSTEKFEALRRHGIEPLPFDGGAIGSDMAAALKETTHLVLSAAPEDEAQMKFDPLSASLRSAPLPRSTGERMGAKSAAGVSSPLTKWGRGAEQSEAERGRVVPSGIALPMPDKSAESGGGDPFMPHIGDRRRDLMPKLRWIGYLSTVGVYGDHGGAWVDEKSDCRPVSRRSVARLAAERSWQAFAEREGLPFAILRLAGIYGPGRNALANLAAGAARRIVKPGQVFNRVHVDDIAGALSLLAGAEGDGIFNVADDEPSPPQDVVAFAAGLMGVEPPPEIPFEAAEMTPMARSFYGENKRVSNARIRNAGYAFVYPDYRSALTRMWREDSWR